MWEFMSRYAESFWKAGDYAFEIFSTIMAWAITIGVPVSITIFIATIPAAIKEYLEFQKRLEEDRKEFRKRNGM